MLTDMNTHPVQNDENAPRPGETELLHQRDNTSPELNSIPSTSTNTSQFAPEDDKRVVVVASKTQMDSRVVIDLTESPMRSAAKEPEPPISSNSPQKGLHSPRKSDVPQSLTATVLKSPDNSANERIRDDKRLLSPLHIGPNSPRAFRPTTPRAFQSPGQSGPRPKAEWGPFEQEQHFGEESILFEGDDECCVTDVRKPWDLSIVDLGEVRP